MADFVHLHLHSEYSLLDGACRISEIPKAAKAAGHTAAAITDHGAMYGVVDFYRACRDEGIQPIIGCEVYVAARTLRDKTHEYDAQNYHLVLLVKNETGYQNLISMVSTAFIDGFYAKPRIDLALLREHAEGLIALSACLAGRIPQYILNDDISAAEEYALQMREIFGPDGFYLELQDHGIPEQVRVNAALSALSKRTGIPMVATNDVHYLKKEDAATQAVMMCIQTNTTIQEGRPVGFPTDEFYYKSTDEMAALFSAYEGALENTVKIAGMCHFDFHFDQLYLPRFIPEDGSNPKMYLRKLALAGLQERMADGRIICTDEDGMTYDDYKGRMEYELFIISRMGYDEYYLIVQDFVNYARTHDIPTGPGRGSGAGSLVAYLIGITEIDSIRHKLLFERFLNPERVSMPDFDIDFCDEKRDEVIEYVAHRYGRDHVSQIITFGTMAARAAVRDVGRALGMSYGEVDIVARTISQKPGITLKEALEGEELKTMYDEDPRIRRLIDISMALEGMPRHASTHAAGVVITDRPVSDYVPLAVSSGTIVTQFDMNTVASLGLLKFDFLALRYLTILDDTEKEIRKTEADFDLRRIPEDDSETFDLISAGQTDGVFQLESAGMKQMLIEFRPRSISDIMMAIALYRPGPMDSISKFIENRRDPKKIHYEIPALAPILDPTFGCIIYQEQVMQICRTIAGYSYGKADVVRKAMAKKNAAVMEKERDTFLAGAARNFVDADAASRLFDEMAGFASYAFNKSHAASYAYTSYRTAYLKCHYPKQYFAALLTSVLGNAGKMSAYIAECGRRGIKVLPPDVNESGINFCVSGENIRFGLLALKNVGQNFVEGILAGRRDRPYRSLDDLIDRLSGRELNKRAVEALIKSGACDCFGIYRSRMLEAYGPMVENAAKKSHADLEGQIGLFDSGTESGLSTAYPEIDELSIRDKLRMEKEAAGFYFSGHLTDGYTRHAEQLGAVAIHEIRMAFEEEGNGTYQEGQILTLSGIVTARTVKQTRNGDSMAFITLEDRYADIEVVVFPKVFALCAALLTLENAVAIKGKLQIRNEEPPKLLAQAVIPLLSNTDMTVPGVQIPHFTGERDTGNIPVNASSDLKTVAPSETSDISESLAAFGTRSPQPLIKSAAPSMAAIPEQYLRPYRPAESKTPRSEPDQSFSRTAVTPQLPRLFLKVSAMTGTPFEKAVNLLEIFCGNTEVIFYNMSNGKYIRANALHADATPFLLHELERVLGAGCVVLK